MKRIFYAFFLVTLVLSLAEETAYSSPQVSSSAQVLKITHAAHLRPTLEYGEEIKKFNALVQKDIGIIMYFLDWNTSGLGGGYFDPYLPNKIQETFGSSGPVIMLTWAPLSGKRPGCTRDYSGAIPLNDIIAGLCDNYIRGFALELKSRPERFLLRFAHEMNISDLPWWPGHFGQDASAYVQMWRHVHDVFSSQNVPNVEWVWAANYMSYPREPWNDRNNYYPGDEYVDWVGVDGFNYERYLSIPWMTFSDIFDSEAQEYVLKDFACRYPKPQIIAEFGSVDSSQTGHYKTDWIADAYQQIPQFPFLRSVIWFNDYASANPQSADFRVTTGTMASGSVSPLPPATGAWTNAYRQAISNPIYNSTLPSLEEATPPSTYCGNGEPIYQVNPDETLIDINQVSLHDFLAMPFEQEMTLSLRVPENSYLTGTFNPAFLSAPWGTSELTIEASPSTPPGTYIVFVQGNGVDLVSITVQVTQSIFKVYLPILPRY